jgi:hypothetical protein
MFVCIDQCVFGCAATEPGSKNARRLEAGVKAIIFEHVSSDSAVREHGEASMTFIGYGSRWGDEQKKLFDNAGRSALYRRKDICKLLEVPHFQKFVTSFAVDLTQLRTKPKMNSSPIWNLHSELVNSMIGDDD